MKGEIEIDIEGTLVNFHYTYEPGDPGIHTYPNGDPGYPGTGPDVNILYAYAAQPDNLGNLVEVDVLELITPYIDLDDVEQQIIEEHEDWLGIYK